MLVVPSPKKQTATWSVPRYCADHAAPLAIVRCAPMMAYEPITPCSMLVRCIEPPLPPSRPLARPSSSARTLHADASGKRVRMASVGGERVVVRTHRCSEPGCNGLHAQ